MQSNPPFTTCRSALQIRRRRAAVSGCLDVLGVLCQGRAHDQATTYHAGGFCSSGTNIDLGLQASAIRESVAVSLAAVQVAIPNDHHQPLRRTRTWSPKLQQSGEFLIEGERLGQAILLACEACKYLLRKATSRCNLFQDFATLVESDIAVFL